MGNGILRVGIVGYGLAGSVFHAPLVRACTRMELTGILTSRDVALRVGSLEALIQVCDLIVIASPNPTHFPIALQALEAGCHIVVDKPFTTSIDEADQLIECARERARVLSVFHNRRWDSDFLTVRSLLRELGEVMLFEASWDRFRPAIKQGWRELAEPGSGLLSDLGAHLIDQAVQLFGMPQSLEADILTQRNGAVADDYFDLRLHYSNRRVSLCSSTLVAAPRPRFAVHGTRGSFVKHGLDPQEAQLKANLDPLDPAFGIDPIEGRLTHADGRSEAVAGKRGNYLAFYEAVADAILDGAAPPVTAEDARDTIALIDLARRAFEQGRRLPVGDSSSKAS